MCYCIEVKLNAVGWVVVTYIEGLTAAINEYRKLELQRGNREYRLTSPRLP